MLASSRFLGDPAPSTTETKRVPARIAELARQ